MAQAKNATTISAHVPNEIVAIIDRARAGVDGGISRSKFLSYMVTRWYLDGCPKFADHVADTLAIALYSGRLPPLNEPLELAVAEDPIEWGKITQDARREAEQDRAATSAQSDASDAKHGAAGKKSVSAKSSGIK